MSADTLVALVAAGVGAVAILLIILRDARADADAPCCGCPHGSDPTDCRKPPADAETPPGCENP